MTTTLIIAAVAALAYFIIRSWVASARKLGKAEVAKDQLAELKRYTDEQGKVRAHGATLSDDVIRRRVRKPTDSS